MNIFRDWLFGKISPVFDQLPFRVRSAGHFCIDPTDRENVRTCFFVELFWCIEGSCNFTYPEGVFTLNPGEVCFYNSGCTHNFMPLKNGFRYRWMALEGAMAESIFQGFKTSRLPHYAGACPEELFCLLMKQIADNSPEMVLASLATAFKILTLAITPAIGQQRIIVKHAEIAKALIDEGFRNSDMNINSLADQLHIHRVSLSRSFRQHYKTSISEYLTDKRLEYSSHLLLTTNLTVKQIALMSGFNDPTYFSSFFRKKMKNSPNIYRLSK